VVAGVAASEHKPAAVADMVAVAAEYTFAAAAVHKLAAVAHMMLAGVLERQVVAELVVAELVAGVQVVLQGSCPQVALRT